MVKQVVEEDITKIWTLYILILMELLCLKCIRDMHQQTNIGMTAQVFHKLNIFTCVLKLKKRPLQKAYLRDIESS